VRKLKRCRRRIRKELCAIRDEVGGAIFIILICFRSYNWSLEGNYEKWGSFHKEILVILNKL
jgi:hypothetical protein